MGRSGESDIVTLLNQRVGETGNTKQTYVEESSLPDYKRLPGLCSGSACRVCSGENGLDWIRGADQNFCAAGNEMSRKLRKCA